MTAKCTGRSSRTGEPCQAYPVRGAAVCVAHGGKAPQVKAKARQRRTEQAAKAELARLNLTPVDDPLTALASVTAEVLAWKDQIAAKVNDLTSLRYSTEGGEQLRAEVALWERALDRCERFLTAMARLNIDERLTAIAEAQAQAVIDAFRAGLEAAGVGPEQRRVALAAARDRLAA